MKRYITIILFFCYKLIFGQSNYECRPNLTIEYVLELCQPNQLALYKKHKVSTVIRMEDRIKNISNGKTIYKWYNLNQKIDSFKFYQNDNKGNLLISVQGKNIYKDSFLIVDESTYSRGFGYYFDSFVYQNGFKIKQFNITREMSYKSRLNKKSILFHQEFDTTEILKTNEKNKFVYLNSHFEKYRKYKGYYRKDTTIQIIDTFGRLVKNATDSIIYGNSDLLNYTNCYFNKYYYGYPLTKFQLIRKDSFSNNQLVASLRYQYNSTNYTCLEIQYIYNANKQLATITNNHSTDLAYIEYDKLGLIKRVIIVQNNEAIGYNFAYYASIEDFLIKYVK